MQQKNVPHIIFQKTDGDEIGETTTSPIINENGESESLSKSKSDLYADEMDDVDGNFED